MNTLQKRTTKKSTLKLEVFNECPGAREFKAALKAFGFTAAEFVDSERNYYQNTHDTAVFTVPQNGELLRFATILHQTCPDEFTYYFDNHLQKYVVRLWWD